MERSGKKRLPNARRDQLIVRELPNEILVYDQDRHTAHCLNKTSALVWKHCDGKMTMGQMARLIEREFGASVDDDFILLAVSQLRKFDLLEQNGAAGGTQKVSRRDVALKYLPAALALPVILSIGAPTRVQAASAPCNSFGACNLGPCCPGQACKANGFCDTCLPPGALCNALPPDCCAGIGTCPPGVGQVCP